MTVSPESIEVGKCYLSRAGEVQRVLQFLPRDKVHYEYRGSPNIGAYRWTESTLEFASFVVLLEREVPCDWTPATDEA
jgi:hypothetical protein